MECNVGSIHAMLSPHTVHVLSDLIQSINTTLTGLSSNKQYILSHSVAWILTFLIFIFHHRVRQLWSIKPNCKIVLEIYSLLPVTFTCSLSRFPDPCHGSLLPVTFPCSLSRFPDPCHFFLAPCHVSLLFVTFPYSLSRFPAPYHVSLIPVTFPWLPVTFPYSL